jgi:hypothetical protein
LPLQAFSALLLGAAYVVSALILFAVLVSVASHKGANFAGLTSTATELSGQGTDFQSGSTTPNATSPAVRLILEIVELDAGQHTTRLQVSARVLPEALTSQQLDAYQGGTYSDGRPGLPVRILGYGETFVYRIQQLSAENKDDSAKTTYLAYPSGSTSRYPFDRYTSSIGIVPPTGLPVTVSVSLSPAWSDPYTLTARDITQVFPPASHSPEFIAIALEGKRSLSTGLFALLVALSPMFLLVIAWHQLTFDRRTRTSRGRSQEHVVQALPLELGAAFLALLTLRQVLVPGDIAGPTIIDGILALELSLFVALLVHAWAARVRRLA